MTSDATTTSSHVPEKKLNRRQTPFPGKLLHVDDAEEAEQEKGSSAEVQPSCEKEMRRDAPLELAASQGSVSGQPTVTSIAEVEEEEEQEGQEEQEAETKGEEDLSRMRDIRLLTVRYANLFYRYSN